MNKTITRLKTEFTFAFSTFLLVNAFAQFDPQTNAQSAGSSEPFQFPVQVDTVVNSIPCTQNDFYSTDATGTIKHYQLSGSAVTSLGVMMQKPGCYSIAVNDNLDGGNPSPTFYGDSLGYWSPVYYNTNGWTHQAPPAPATWHLLNCGGAGPYSYYMREQNNVNLDIVRFDGTTWTVLFSSPPGRRIMIADLAVDAMGNVYFLGGPMIQSSFWSDSMYIMAPTGQITTRLPFATDVNNAYGSMVIHGVFHIGFGSGNPNFPNTLMPVEVINNTVVAGTPINFQCVGCYDLASCDPGGPKNAIEENSAMDNELLLSPDPASSGISFTTTGKSTWEIYTAEGSLVMEGTADGQCDVEITLLSAGMYFLSVVDEQGVTRSARFVVER